MVDDTDPGEDGEEGESDSGPCSIGALLQRVVLQLGGLPLVG